MDEIFNFIEDKVKDIKDESLKQDERYRMRGIIDEKIDIYIKNNVTKEDAIKMAFLECQTLEAKSDKRLEALKKEENELFDTRPKYLYAIFIMAVVEFIGFIVLMLIKKPVITTDWSYYILYITDCLITVFPMLVVTLYLKARKQSLRNFGSIVAFVFLLISTIQIFQLIFE